MRHSSLSTGVFFFTIGMVFTKCSSFFVNMALTWKYGAGIISDAIIVATSIPTIIFAGLIASVAMCFVPLYKEIENTGRGDGNRMTSNVFNGLSIIVFLVCVLIFARPQLFIRLLANGMSEEAMLLAADIARGVAVACVFSAGTGVLQGFLQANGKFRMVSISSLPVNVVLMLCIIMSSSQSVAGWISIGVIAAYALQIGLFFVESQRTGFKWKAVCDIKDRYCRRLLIAVVPLLISTLIYDVNAVIDKNFASFLEAGSISVLEYGFKVAGAAQGLLAYPVTTILYTKLADDSSRGDIESLNHTLSLGIEHLTRIMVPAITGMMLTSRWITEVLFGRGNFDEYAIMRTSGCMILYLVGMYAVAYRAMMEKAFYSMGMTMVTLSNGIVTVAVNVLMDFIGYRIWGCYGLALATSISMIVSALYMWFVLFKKCHITLDASVGKVFGNVLISVAVMGMSVTGLRFFFEGMMGGYGERSRLTCAFALAVTAIVGMLVFAICMYIQKDLFVLHVCNKVLRGDK